MTVGSASIHLFYGLPSVSRTDWSVWHRQSDPTAIGSPTTLLSLQMRSMSKNALRDLNTGKELKLIERVSLKNLDTLNVIFFFRNSIIAYFYSSVNSKWWILAISYSCGIMFSQQSLTKVPSLPQRRLLMDFRKARRVLRITGTTIVGMVVVGAILAAVAVIMSGSDNDLIQMEKFERNLERLNQEPFPSPAGAPAT